MALTAIVTWDGQLCSVSTVAAHAADIVLAFVDVWPWSAPVELCASVRCWAATHACACTMSALWA